MDWITKIVESLKLKPRYVLMAAVFSGAILFLPEKILSGIGVLTLQKDYRAWFGLGFLLSLCILVVHLAAHTKDFIRSRVQLRAMRRCLHGLTEEEKDVLRYYIGGKTITQKLHPMNGVVAQLEAREVIGRSTSMGSIIEGWAYNIQPWAWDYLNKHPHLLDRKDGLSGPQEAPRYIDPSFD